MSLDHIKEFISNTLIPFIIRYKFILIIILLLLYLLKYFFANQDQQHDNKNVLRPVQYEIVKYRNIKQPLSLTGEIAAKNEASLSFRVDGKLIERLVSLGDKVTANQIIAKLDPQDIKDSLTTAKSNLTAAEAVLKQAASEEARQKALYEKQYATKAQYDKMVQQLQSANSQVEVAKATLNQAQNRLNYTDLRSDVAGIVTKTFADAGEVVRSGQAIVKIATDEGLDAVFNVPEKSFQKKFTDLSIEISLSYNPNIKASGTIRQISPQADPVTRTFVVKVSLTNPPKEMKLGSTVIGNVISDKGSAVELPASALNKSNENPAVWVVDQNNHTLSLRNITVEDYTEESVIVVDGLKEGDIVVTAGIQSLYPGQQVKLLETK